MSSSRESGWSGSSGENCLTREALVASTASFLAYQLVGSDQKFLILPLQPSLHAL